MLRSPSTGGAPLAALLALIATSGIGLILLPAFPSRVVTVTRAPHSAVVFDVTCTGEPLAPSAVRPPFSEEEYRRGIPADGAVLEADFATLGGGPLA